MLSSDPCRAGRRLGPADSRALLAADPGRAPASAREVLRAGRSRLSAGAETPTEVDLGVPYPEGDPLGRGLRRGDARSGPALRGGARPARRGAAPVSALALVGRAGAGRRALFDVVAREVAVAAAAGTTPPVRPLAGRLRGARRPGWQRPAPISRSAGAIPSARREARLAALCGGAGGARAGAAALRLAGRRAGGRGASPRRGGGHRPRGACSLVVPAREALGAPFADGDRAGAADGGRTSRRCSRAPGTSTVPPARPPRLRGPVAGQRRDRRRAGAPSDRRSAGGARCGDASIRRAAPISTACSRTAIARCRRRRRPLVLALALRRRRRSSGSRSASSRSTPRRWPRPARPAGSRAGADGGVRLPSAAHRRGARRRRTRRCARASRSGRSRVLGDGDPAARRRAGRRRALGRGGGGLAASGGAGRTGRRRRGARPALLYERAAALGADAPGCGGAAGAGDGSRFARTLRRRGARASRRRADGPRRRGRGPPAPSARPGCGRGAATPRARAARSSAASPTAARAGRRRWSCARGSGACW